MRLFVVSTLLVMIIAANSLGQSTARSLEGEPISVAVTDLQVEAPNINHLLAKIAYKYGVPMSLEVAIDEDLLKSKPLKVNMRKGTLVDVLDCIVKEKPSYTWAVSEGTIKVFPRSDFRDPLLQTLLETRISHFVVQERTAKFTFRKDLTNRVELKSLLASYSVRPLNETFLSSDIQSFGRDFSMDLENVSVRSILNYVIKNSQTKYWFITRDGDSFLINF